MMSPLLVWAQGADSGAVAGFSQLDFKPGSWVLSHIGSEYDGHCQPEHKHQRSQIPMPDLGQKKWVKSTRSILQVQAVWPR